MPLVHDDLAFSFLQNFFDTNDSDFAKKKNDVCFGGNME